MVPLFNKGSMKHIAIFLVVSMSFISMIPRAEAAFIPSDESYSLILKEKEMAVVQNVLEHKIVKGRLSSLGYSEREISERLNQLSDEEIHELAGQIDTLVSAGDGLGFVIGLLVIALLVILILKLFDKQIIIE
ncbi:MAG: PA2779 family protein [Thermodesulfobacteriota bacterium]|nr:PA2779 family protein [Thermodesulfobacteriota bacterium]